MRAANVARYEGDRRALSATVKVHEVKDLLDRSAALVEYARRAKGAEPIARATEPRLYAVRRLRTAQIALHSHHKTHFSFP